MKYLHKNKLLSAASLIAIYALTAPVVAAQDAQSVENDDGGEKVLDTIVVRGIAGSVSQSVLDKRNASKIVDTINAEDIGKSTDQNIAEALNRVSGVSMSSVDGEGALISIRGASPDQTVVTLNGAALGTTEFGQAVDLSSYSADVLSKVEIIKTPAADDEEGSLGGLVNLQTRKPLEIDEDVRSFSVQGRYNDLADETNYKLSGVVSEKFFNDKLGVIVSVVDETNSIRRDQIRNDDFRAHNTWGATDQNGNFITNSFNLADYDLTMPGAGATQEEIADYNSRIAAVGNPYDTAIWGIAPTRSQYSIFNGKRDRQALDIGTQWQITEKTDLTVNVSYASQTIDNVTDEVGIRTPQSNTNMNFRAVLDENGNVPMRQVYVENDDGDLVPSLDDDNNPIMAPIFAHPLSAPGNVFGIAPTFSDPQADWYAIDTDTRTYTKILNRFQSADLNSSIARFENESKTISAELNHEFTDNLRVKLGASLQSVERIPDQQIWMSVQSRENPDYLRFAAGPVGAPGGIEPVGTDCSSGLCQPIVGTSFIDRGRYINEPTPEEIAEAAAEGYVGVIGNSVTNRGSDNRSLTGYNPDDAFAQSINSLSQTVTAVKDEQTTAFIDLDYDLNKFGLTTLELGGKYTKREKFTDAQTGSVTNTKVGVSVVDPETGREVLVGNNLDQTPISGFSRRVGGDGLWASLGLNRNALTDDFVSFDAESVFNLVAADPNLAIDIDDSATRGADFENIALYAKQNFSFYDDRVSGNIGVRYVKTEVETTGAGGLRAFNESFGRNQRVLDLGVLRSLSDSSKPECAASPIYEGAQLNTFDQYRYSRIDGLGVDTKGTVSFLDDTRIDNLVPEGGCFEPLLANAETFLAAGDEGRNALLRWNNAFFTNNYFWTFDDDPSNGAGFVVTDPGGPAEALTSINNTIHTVPTAGSHEYDVFLPSMNINWAVTDDVILRFAASKSMTRPNIDSLRPGFQVNENGWGSPATKFSTVNLFNTQLDPLESINIDTSVEWYFAKDALLSLGLFYKDITNLEETEEQVVYLSDIKGAIQNGEAVDGNGLILSADELTHDNCFAHITGSWQVSRDPQDVANAIFGSPEQHCARFNASQVRNAAGAEILGMELQYTQNYSFLPGIWSGLGVSANYTYQDSSFDAEESNLVQGEVLPSFQIIRTPEHSYNVTAYWQDGGHQVRLAYGGASDVLLNRAYDNGALWEEGRETLDFSASYELSENFSLTFDASNILEQPLRQYWTSRQLELPTDALGTTDFVAFDEGNALDGEAPKHRTALLYNTGRIFRLGLRAQF
ncbi:TonB-dependent receptor [Hirschia litorea]|uniref:TonB-dependent receptor n=1 Tax=Hirschia litorea TaxID=1199156 RepID=A0ABW2IPH6_9PROT